MREDLCWDDYVATQAPYPPHLPGRPVYLSGVQTPALARLALDRYRVGLILNPAARLETWSLLYAWWAVDNGCYRHGDAFDGDGWLTWLDTLPRDRCLFVVAPDVYHADRGGGDADATWVRSEPYLAAIRTLGFPVALALQDGADAHLATWDEADRWDAAFIGGSTAWKLSEAARDCATEAALLGKWVHVGRVNTWTRLAHLAAWPVDSVDGTRLKHVPPGDPHLARWLDRLDARADTGVARR